MKKFFLNVLSSFVGTWIAIVLAGVVAVLLVVAAVSKMAGGPSVSLDNNSVLEIKLNGPVTERDDARSISVYSILSDDFTVPLSLETLTTAINEAKTNDNIKAIYLDCGAVSAAPATLQALRQALVDFKTSGKKVYAYADVMTQGSYFVATVADEISLNPAGNVSFYGLGGQTLFYKDFFDKIGLQFQAVRVGKGKAAVEPYTLDTMSNVAREQNMTLLNTLWSQIRTDIDKSRPAVTPALMDSLINVEYVSQRPAKYVLDARLVDRLEYRHAFEERLASAVGQEPELEGRIYPEQLALFAPVPSYEDNNQVAVLYACGGIDDIAGGSGIDSDKLVKDILKLKENENVKALVLRVNSPGGSAFGSEQIWEALETFKKTGKPFVVSMGDYAASGGYYISCGADRIFANPMCVTGSIGIFGLIPNIHGLMEKLGINSVTVATNPAGQFPDIFDPMDPRQEAAMQRMVEDGYELFVKRCADGRKMDVGKIKEIADGRPLPAALAKKYGLVDELGGLDSAIKYAAKQAKLKEGDYNTVPYPMVEMSLAAFMASLQNGTSEVASIVRLFTCGDVETYAEQARSLLQGLRSPYLIRTETAPISIRF